MNPYEFSLSGLSNQTLTFYTFSNIGVGVVVLLLMIILLITVSINIKNPMSFFQKILVFLVFISVIWVSMIFAIEYELSHEVETKKYKEINRLKLNEFDTNTLAMIESAGQDKILTLLEYHCILNSRQQYIEQREKRMNENELKKARHSLFEQRD